MDKKFRQKKDNKLKMLLAVTIMTIGLLVGCGMAEPQELQESKEEAEITELMTQTQELIDTEEESIEYGDLYDTIFDENCADTIANWIKEIVESSNSLQNEVQSVEELSAAYVALQDEHDSQADLNMISYRSEMVWDAELNNLWSRMSNNLDADTKEEVLSNLRVWNANKENIIIDTIGKKEDGGSIYSLLYNELMESMVRKKVYELADVYANDLGESYEKPECPVLGTYVDHQGSTDIYSSLMIRNGWEGDTEAIISLYRLAMLKGHVTREGNILHYTDNDFNLTGTITYGWDGAIFAVETSDFDNVNAGDIFTFDTVY